jgi:hypothetical protein
MYGSGMYAGQVLQYVLLLKMLYRISLDNSV